MQNFVYALQDWSLCFPQASEWPIIKSWWPSWPDSLGIPIPLSDPQAGKPDMGFRIFIRVGEFLWHYFSPVCWSPTQQVWDLILSWLSPSYHLTAASSLSLNVGYLFLVGSSGLLSVVIQQLVGFWCFCRRRRAQVFSILPSWTRSHICLFIGDICHQFSHLFTK